MNSSVHKRGVCGSRQGQRHIKWSLEHPESQVTGTARWKPCIGYLKLELKEGFRTGTQLLRVTWWWWWQLKLGNWMVPQESCGVMRELQIQNSRQQEHFLVSEGDN